MVRLGFLEPIVEPPHPEASNPQTYLNADPKLSTFSPETTSSATSGRQQIEQTFSFGGHVRIVLSRCRFDLFRRGLRQWSFGK